MKLLWSLFGALSEGLKDNAALEMKIAADGKMELVSDKHLVFDDDSSEHASSDTPVTPAEVSNRRAERAERKARKAAKKQKQAAKKQKQAAKDKIIQQSDTPKIIQQSDTPRIIQESDTTCRTVASDCRITESTRVDNRRLENMYKKATTKAVKEYNQENPVLNPEAVEALAEFLDSCQAMCTNDIKCKNFYFLKNRATGEEECWFYEAAFDDAVAYIEEDGMLAAAGDTSKWNLCIWQPESNFVGQGYGLCDNKVSRTPAEEAAEMAVRVAAFKAKKAAETAKRLGVPVRDKSIQQPDGEVGESIQFKNVVQGKCLSASDGPNGKVTFSNCDDTSKETLWTKRPDGSYESAAHPGRCPRRGNDATSCRSSSCEWKYEAVLGDCPGFITWFEGTVPLQLKLGKDVCLGTWTKTAYVKYIKSDGSPAYKRDKTAINPEYQSKVMTSPSPYHCDEVSGYEWVRVVTTAPSP